MQLLSFLVELHIAGKYFKVVMFIGLIINENSKIYNYCNLS